MEGHINFAKSLITFRKNLSKMESYFVAILGILLLIAASYTTDAGRGWPWGGTDWKHPRVTKTSVPESYCMPGQACWPSKWDILLLKVMIVGNVILPTDASYPDESPVDSLQHKKKPGMIVQVSCMYDVQRTLSFVRRFNLQLSIYSTGHEYTGRSTADGSVQMSMVKMDAVDIDLADTRSDTGASVTVQTGANFGRIYEAADKVGKVVVGGFEHTVGPGGLISGGGHGPVSRYLGLAVDSLIRATIVLANGDVARLSATKSTIETWNSRLVHCKDNDLFWAIRGGGAGTFGVIIDLTLKLHEPPAQVVQYEAYYPLVLNNEVNPVGKGVIELMHQILPHLPNEWSGLVISTGLPFPIPVPVPGLSALVALNLLHYGPWEQDSMKAIQPLIDFFPEARLLTKFTNHTSVWSYAQTFIPNKTVYRGYTAGATMAITDLTPGLTDFYVRNAQTAPAHLKGVFNFCAEVLLGGKVTTYGNMEGESTSVSVAQRQAAINVQCYLSWADPSDDSVGFELGKAMGEELHSHATGIYLNEAAYYLPSWKTDFWGGNYNKLLEIKRRYDPGNVFYCRHCIGDEASDAENGNTRRTWRRLIPRPNRRFRGNRWT